MKQQKGFTIIELIVVIAIIAVLATIVLVNVTQYINKGKDAAIKGNMNTILTNAAVFFNENSSTYVGFKASNGYLGPKTQIEANDPATGGDVVAIESASAFCAKILLHDASTYCVDSTGFKGTATSGACVSSDYTCQ